MRFFLPRRISQSVWLEIAENGVKKKEWAWGWTHIKLRCEHDNTHFVLKMLERIDAGGTKVVGQGLTSAR